MRLVPESYKRRYFRKAADGQLWQASPCSTEMVAFRQHNLLDPLRDGPFDLVFLKNVLIYFDAESKRRVMGNVRAAICPGGLLVAGPAEGHRRPGQGFHAAAAMAVPAAPAMNGSQHERLAAGTPRTSSSTACWATSSTSRTSS